MIIYEIKIECNNRKIKFKYFVNENIGFRGGAEYLECSGVLRGTQKRSAAHEAGAPITTK